MDNKEAGLNVLEVAASGRSKESVSRMLSADLVDALEARFGDIELTQRDLSRGLSFVDEAWIDANFTAAEERTASQRAALAESDALVEELMSADILVIGMPVYNFGIPATLKAWVDMITRARLTFRYTENGPEGLVKGKKAYIVLASGGVPVDSPVDHATPYMRQALSFIGIDDIEIIAADQLGNRAADAVDEARARIAKLVHTQPIFNGRAA